MPYNFQTTNFQNTFGNPQQGSNGYFQGFTQDDYTFRTGLARGILAASETFPMWGGVAISETLNTGTGVTTAIGNTIARATSETNITGFCVFDQNSSANINTFSNVPLIGVNGGVNFYRLGSKIRLAVAVEPSFAATLQGGSINQQVTWDFNTQMLMPYEASGSTVSVTSLTPTYHAASPGQQAYWSVAAVAGSNTLVGGVGSVINISGATNTGSGGAAAINGNFVVTSFTSATNFTFNVYNTSSSYLGTIAGTIVLNYSGGALPCTILDVNIGNSSTVVYNQTTGYANWLPNQSCALIQI